MKITVNRYAQALYESMKNRNQSEIDKLVLNFSRMLRRNNQLKLAPKIIEKFRTIWNGEHGIIEAEVTTARKLESSQAHKIESYIKEKYSAKEVVLNNRIEEGIKGGIVVRVVDEVLDGSVARQLDNLKTKLVK